MHADAVPGDADLEREANRFAAAFLVPKEPFLDEFPRRLNWDHLYEMKRRWRVSVQALLRRAYDLGILSHATYRRAFVQLNARNERTSEQCEPEREAPAMVSDAIRELERDVPLSAIAARLCLAEGELDLLTRQVAFDLAEP
jgi:Zn-dependent peptidase ImmA (M78 family)